MKGKKGKKNKANGNKKNAGENLDAQKGEVNMAEPPVLKKQKTGVKKGGGADVKAPP